MNTYTTKTLPLDEAIELEAKQNYEVDVWKGLVEEDYPTVKPLYIHAATQLLCEHGVGYLPEMGHHYLVVVEGHHAE